MGNRTTAPSGNDEIGTAVERARTRLLRYSKTVWASFAEPVSLVSDDRGQLVLPPLQFFATSFLVLLVLQRIVLYPDPLSAFELPPLLDRLTPILELVPLTIPALAAWSLLLTAVLPWLVLRLFSPRLSFRRIIYASCYLQGGPVAVFGAVSLFIGGFLIYLPKKTQGSLQFPLDLALFAFLIYSIVWQARVLRTVSGVRTWTVLLALSVSAVTLALADDYISPIRGFAIVSESMVPTLNPGDRIVVNVWTYRWRAPRPGELVLFRPDGDAESNPYVFRVVGGSNDKISYAEGTLTVNGHAVATGEPRPASFGYETGSVHQEVLGEITYDVFTIPARRLKAASIVVPPGHVFLMGDSRDNARDSRFLGPIPYDQVIGHAYFKVSKSGTGPL